MKSEKKDTVLWIGNDMQYSLKDGMSWHLNIPGHKLSDLLAKKYNLQKGDADQWSVNSGSLYLRGNELPKEFLSKRVIGTVFDYRIRSIEKFEISKKIFFYLQNNFPGIRLLNSPIDLKTCSNKIEFSKHISQLPNAKSLLPDWKTLETEEDLDNAIEAIGFPLLIKPDSLASGKGIVKIKDRKTAIKVLKSSYKGKYYKSKWRNFKDIVKKVITRSNHSLSSNTPVKLLVSDFVDTWHPKYNCFINANIYYWMGDLYYADARVSHKGFNIHADDSSNEKLTIEQYGEIVSQVMRLVKRESQNIKEIIQSFNQILIRVDCLINLDEDLFKIAEITIKGGPGSISKNKIIPLMDKVGWDEKTIRSYLNGRACSINHLFE